MKAVFITADEANSGFEPLVRLRTQEMIHVFRNLGVEVLPIKVQAFAQLIQDKPNKIAELGPDFISAPNFNYFLSAARNAESFDCLEAPIVALWDDPLGALANFTDRQPGRFAEFLTKIVKGAPLRGLERFAQSLADGCGDARTNFRKVMQHPLLKHFSWDSGHIETVDSLGLLDSGRVTWYPVATYSAFLEVGTHRNDVPKVRDLAFCGNVYPALVKDSMFSKNQLLTELTTKICELKTNSLNKPLWKIMMEEIEKLPPRVRRDFGLAWDQKPFWDYYVFMVWYAANTWVRLGILSKVERQVSLHGLFADPNSVAALKNYPNLKYEGNAHHFNDLPTVHASTKINICISNGLVYSGIPSKLIDCLASGGFALTDPKEDLVRFFGPTIERIFYRNAEELNSKIDYYLAHPVERDEIVRDLGEKIREHCTLEELFKLVINRVKT